jgi:HD-GYP domain-containing protein (c-di-GMP phosphodiesterase class II)
MTAVSGFRLAELMAVLACATDLAMGQPEDHALSSCVLAMRLADAAGLSEDERRDAYYQALLRFIGCNADTHLLAAVVGDEAELRKGFARIDGADRGEALRLALRLIRNAHPGASPLELLRAMAQGMLVLGTVDRELFPGHCEVAQRLGERLGFSTGFVRGLGQLYARWDGRGVPAIEAEAITPPVRVVVLAQDMTLFHRLGGPEAAMAAARKRRGRQYDPRFVDLFLAHAPALLSGAAAHPRWEDVLALEPGVGQRLDGPGFDDACAVLADFADLKSPWTLTHSRGVSALAARAAASVGADPAQLAAAGMLHDIGRVGVSAGIWGKPGPLSEGEWEKARQHAYYTQRILGRSPALSQLAELASCAHERLDGGGYFRGARGSSIDRGARLLAAADVFCALTEARAHRPALAQARAAEHLLGEARAGRLDTDAVHAVLEAAGGAPARPPARVAGLSEREVQVLALLARGNSNKQIARVLGVSPKTVGNQLQSAYVKCGVRTRAGATLYCIEHGLLG